MTVPFPNGALDPFMEVAFGADIDGDPALWTWYDLTEAFMAQTVTTQRGRADESSDVTATNADMQLDNPNGDLTPDDARSIYWPNVDLGTPARQGIKNTIPRLEIPPLFAARAEVLSTSALNLTADLDVRIDAHIKTVETFASTIVIASRADDGGPYSWRLQFSPDRKVTLKWSTDGTPTSPLSIQSSLPIIPSSARTVLRVTLDVNNGAGGHTARFYLGESMSGPWTQIGPDEVRTGTTTIFNAAADLVVGMPPDVSAENTLDADFYKFQLLDGIDGTPLANADFTAQTSDVNAFVDAAGRTWMIEESAMLTNRWCRIYGTVDEWNPVWPWGDLSNQQVGGIDEGQARVNISINGILRRLGAGALPLQSALRRAIEARTFTQAYWPMEDDADSTRFASALSNGAPMLVGGGVTFASDDTLAGSKALPKITGSTFFSGPVAGVFTGAWEVDWYMYWPSGFSGNWVFLRITGSGLIRTWEITSDPTTITIKGYNANGVQLITKTGSAVGMFDKWIGLQFAVRQNGANFNYELRWTPVTYPLSAVTTIGDTFNNAAAGGVTAVGLTPGTGVTDMRVGHIAVYNVSDLVATTRAASGWVGEYALERIDRLCTEQGISLRSIGDVFETALVGVQTVDTLLNLLDAAADADGGILYEQSCAVGLAYRTRSSLYNQPTNLTLSGLDPHQVANPFAPIRDDQRIRNAVTVERQGGSSSTIVDSASIAKHGLYDESVTLVLYLDSQTTDAASWRLHQGTVPGMRYPQLTTNLGDAPVTIDPWLTIDVGSKIAVVDLPPQHPTADVELMVEGYAEPISPTTWDPTANCSPASVWDVTELDGAWVDDQYLLRLETDGSILAAPITAGATTAFVTVTDGPAWVTAGGEFPFDIEMEGEQATVTAIGTPSGGQEFIAASSFDDITATTLFVAPGVNALAANDLLITAWCSYANTGTYTLPGGMTSQELTSGASCSLQDASEVLAGGGPTGNRTATFSASDTWSAVTIAVHGAAGPTIEAHVGAVSAPGPVTLSVEGDIGDWLLAIQAWEWDPGGNMGPPSGGDWIPLVSSSPDPVVTASRIRVWIRRITTGGPQFTTFNVVPLGVTDNHARLYMLHGVTGFTQQFTIVRSVNGVAKAHAVSTPVSLWFDPVLAR